MGLPATAGLADFTGALTAVLQLACDPEHSVPAARPGSKGAVVAPPAAALFTTADGQVQRSASAPTTLLDSSSSSFLPSLASAAVAPMRGEVALPALLATTLDLAPRQLTQPALPAPPAVACAPKRKRSLSSALTTAEQQQPLPNAAELDIPEPASKLQRTMTAAPATINAHSQQLQSTHSNPASTSAARALHKHSSCISSPQPHTQAPTPAPAAALSALVGVDAILTQLHELGLMD